MTNKVVIRGVEKGTLVLVDGVPINQSGRYNLEDIPTDAVEKIEIVRGGGAVLYGSEASGGVINIITKEKKQPNPGRNRELRYTELCRQLPVRAAWTYLPV